MRSAPVQYNLRGTIWRPWCGGSVAVRMQSAGFVDVNTTSQGEAEISIDIDRDETSDWACRGTRPHVSVLVGGQGPTFEDGQSIDVRVQLVGAIASRPKRKMLRCAERAATDRTPQLPHERPPGR